MSSNKKVKEELIKRYGAKCFIEKLKLRKDDIPRRYKSKHQRVKMKQLTYHHIKMKKDGGEATIENGALLSTENHIWFHKQDRQDQDYMNNLFQEYKKNFIKCDVVVDDNIDITVVPLIFHIKEKERYNRAKEKRELQKLINDELYK